MKETIVMQSVEESEQQVLNQDSVNYRSSDNVVNGNKSSLMASSYKFSESNSAMASSRRSNDSLIGCSGGKECGRQDEDSSHENVNHNFKSSKEILVEQDGYFTESSTNTTQTLMHLIKGNLGSGLLALPVAFRNAGLWTGLVGILVIGFVTLHCMHVLVKCGRILCRRTGKQRMNYADVAEYCLKNSSSRFARFYGVSRTLVNVLLVFTQLGICCINLVFIADSVSHVIYVSKTYNANVMQKYEKEHSAAWVYELIIVTVLIPYAFIRKLEHLAPFTAFANVLTLVGTVIIFQYIVQDLPDTSTLPSFSSLGEVPLFFGAAFYTLEGINYVLPLENAMKNPEAFASWDGVLNLGMVVVIVLYASMGFYGYLKFGDNVETSITLSLPQDNWLYVSVVLMFAMAIFISYGIQLYVPVNIMWPTLKEKFNHPFIQYYGEYVFRVFFVLVTFLFAAAVPHLDLLIALIGAFASSFLAIILPVLIEIATIYDEERRLPLWLLTKNFIIFLFGVLGCVTGTYSALQKIILTF